MLFLGLSSMFCCYFFRYSVVFRSPVRSLCRSLGRECAVDFFVI